MNRTRLLTALGLFLCLAAGVAGVAWAKCDAYWWPLQLVSVFVGDGTDAAANATERARWLAQGWLSGGTVGQSRLYVTVVGDTGEWYDGEMSLSPVEQ
ncbi:MAG: hypothetical protein GXP62_03130 [Oligoflexia bacterium]|nr:hypothetical protein [Oligoflexia bacterium]